MARRSTWSRTPLTVVIAMALVVPSSAVALRSAPESLTGTVPPAWIADASALAVEPPSAAARRAAEGAGIELRSANTLPATETDLAIALEHLLGESAAEAVTELPDLAPEVEAAVAALVEAVANANRLRAEAYANVPPEDERLLMALARGAPAADPADLFLLRAGDLSGWLPERLDPRPLAEAQVHLLGTVEAVLPALRAASAQPSIDIDRVLAFDGSGDTTWTADYALLIDLQGNDRYENAAGSSVAPDIHVGLLLDVNGDDEYLTHTGVFHGSATQASAVGGVGVLVDAAGSNRYHAESLWPDNPPTNAMVPTVFAQGAAVGGSAALVDLGSSSFRAEAVGAHFPVLVIAQGAALGGQALLMLGNQGNSLIARAEAFPHFMQGDDTSGAALVYAQSFAFAAGVSMVVGGSGDDIYRIEGDGVTSTVNGQAYSSSNAQSTFVDLEGDDLYQIDSRAQVVQRKSESHRCLVAPCDVTATVRAAPVRAVAAGQGAGEVMNAVASLVDLGQGRDEFLLSGVATLDIQLDITGEGGGFSKLTGVIEQLYSGSIVLGQGGGVSDGATPTGGLVFSGAGDDVFTLVSFHEQLRTIKLSGAPRMFGLIQAVSTGTSAIGQGGGNQGSGTLTDSDGSDNYTSVARDRVVNILPAGEEVEPQRQVEMTQGQLKTRTRCDVCIAPAVVSFFDLAGDDTFSTERGRGIEANECSITQLRDLDVVIRWDAYPGCLRSTIEPHVGSRSSIPGGVRP